MRERWTSRVRHNLSFWGRRRAICIFAPSRIYWPACVCTQARIYRSGIFLDWLSVIPEHVGMGPLLPPEDSTHCVPGIAFRYGMGSVIMVSDFCISPQWLHLASTPTADACSEIVLHFSRFLWGALSPPSWNTNCAVIVSGRLLLQCYINNLSPYCKSFSSSFHVVMICAVSRAPQQGRVSVRASV